MSLLPATYLQDYEYSYINEKIVLNYKNLMNDYFETKHLIPKENLYEIKFEEFEKDNMTHLNEIYTQFSLDTWSDAEPCFKAYMYDQKSYQKNKYKIEKAELDTLKKEWAFAMKKFDYQVPENLEIV